MIRVICSILLSCCVLRAGNEVKLLKLAPTAEMDRAELYTWKPPGPIDAIMIFCPGHSGSGEGFARSEVWQKFAEANGIGLCGLSFSSQMTLTKQGMGYSYAARGSGNLLLDGLNQEFGNKKLPLFFYGYSAGARFTTSFLAWKPERVGSWCASGVGTWPPLPQGQPSIAPGIVACGEFDAACYWSSLHYFQSGREKDYPWTWVSLKDLGHGYSSSLDKFVVEYFALRLKSKGDRMFSNKSAVLLDIATERRLDSATAAVSRIFSASLPPDEALIDHWTRIHHP